MRAVRTHDPDLDKTEIGDNYCDPDGQGRKTPVQHSGTASNKGGQEYGEEMHKFHGPKMAMDRIGHRAAAAIRGRAGGNWFGWVRKRHDFPSLFFSDYKRFLPGAVGFSGLI